MLANELYLSIVQGSADLRSVVEHVLEGAQEGPPRGEFERIVRELLA
jgi:hypothetical protein